MLMLNPFILCDSQCFGCSAGNYRRSSSTSSISTEMTASKRKSEFDEFVVSTSASRRKSILETTTREQSKRKWDDDSINSLCQRFSKRLRCQPEKQATLKTNRPHKASRQRLIIEAMLSRIKRYRDKWIPYKPPWITSRVLKQYVGAEGWRKKRVFCPCPKRCVEGLEIFCASIEYRTDPSTYHPASFVSPRRTESAQASSLKKKEGERPKNKAHQPSIEEGEEDL